MDHVNKNALALLASIALVTLSGCASKLEIPKSAAGDVATCANLGSFGHEKTVRLKSYLDELDVTSSTLKDAKFALAFFDGLPGELAKREADAIKVDIESMTASKFVPLVPGDSSARATAILIQKIRNNTDELGVYKINTKSKAIGMYNLVYTACLALEKEYPKDKYLISVD